MVSRDHLSVGYRAAERLVRSRLPTWSIPVDLNHLNQRQLVSQFMAEHAKPLDPRQIHREFAKRYAARIAEAKLSPAGPKVV